MQHILMFYAEMTLKSEIQMNAIWSKIVNLYAFWI